MFQRVTLFFLPFQTKAADFRTETEWRMKLRSETGRCPSLVNSDVESVSDLLKYRNQKWWIFQAYASLQVASLPGSLCVYLVSGVITYESEIPRNRGLFLWVMKHLLSGMIDPPSRGHPQVFIKPFQSDLAVAPGITL